MNRISPLVVSTLTLLGISALAEEGAREVRLSPDGRYFVGWYDHDAGLPFGTVRPIVLRSVSDSYDLFSFVSVPRTTAAEWNSASSMCVIADAPDNGGPNTWLVHRKTNDQWPSTKLDPFKGLYNEFSKKSHGAEMWRPSILKINWISETTVSFHAYCNLGTYLITIDTKEAGKNPVSKKLSNDFLEPAKDPEEPGTGQRDTSAVTDSESGKKLQPNVTNHE
jgi:hypothetical protein